MIQASALPLTLVSLMLIGSTTLCADDAPPPFEVATGPSDPRMESFDRLIAEFMQEHEVPGVSLAVTDQGKLVYARGYGYADLEAREPVTPNSRMRIASISKPITAVAVLRLVEQKKLKLSDRVFSILDYQDEIARVPEFDQRLNDVTIEQLLRHRGGWDRNASFDPMFRSVRFAKLFDVDPPAGPEQVIRGMLRRKLDFAPGERYAYSNFGYCLLGRVIEQVSGQPYEAFMKEQVLAHLGIDSMQIGKTLLKDRADSEVHYYDPAEEGSVFAADLGEPVNSPYGAWYLEAMDAHGGWIATATDLARFTVAFDDPKQCPVLSAESIAAMYAPAETDEKSAATSGGYYYSLGWSNRVVEPGMVNHWHTGSLPGTTTTMIRRHDGRNFIALANTRHTKRLESINGALDQLLHQAANQVKEWPSDDLFEATKGN